MTRMLAFVCALLMSAIAVSSACVAGSVAPLHFTIETANQGDRVQFVRAVSRDIRDR